RIPVRLIERMAVGWKNRFTLCHDLFRSRDADPWVRTPVCSDAASLWGARALRTDLPREPLVLFLDPEGLGKHVRGVGGRDHHPARGVDVHVVSGHDADPAKGDGLPGGVGHHGVATPAGRLPTAPRGEVVACQLSEVPQ